MGASVADSSVNSPSIKEVDLACYIVKNPADEQEEAISNLMNSHAVEIKQL